MQIIIYYEGWQMQCCGTAFLVGDLVEWHANKANNSAGLITADYDYEAHDIAKYKIIGKVIEVNAINYEYKKSANGKYFYPIAYTSNPVEKLEDFNADGYLVVLDEAQVKS